MFPHIEVWRASGLTQNSYCAQHQSPAYIFSDWHKRYKLQKSASIQKGFVAVNLLAGQTLPGSISMELVNPNGTRLLFHSGLILNLLKA